MDYKDTLNLPRTDFPMKADLVAREPERLRKWESTRVYEKSQEQRASGKKFVLHDGPPFANGDVHIGTALNKILKDFVVKYKRLRGFNAPYIPGWDCHGLPIEFMVSQELRKAGNTEVDPAKIRMACDAYARKYIDIQREQFKRLGILGDWANPYLTLNKAFEAEELRLFADIVEQGFVYRGKKPVYWSIPCRTALAEAEVEYKDHASPSIFVRFAVLDRPNTFVVIWTTTPWTLPANLAVAYNSKLQYVRVHVGDDFYILFRGLLPIVGEKCGWSGYSVEPVAAAELATLQYSHPFCNRIGKLFAGDNFVTSDSGTGFVHIAPGHGLEDYGIGLQHGLPIYSPVDDDGRFARTTDLPVDQQMPEEMIGKSILEKHGKSDANEAVLHELRLRHALLHQENYHHSYPHCWRSKTPVIFRAMDQWFIEIDHKIASKGGSDESFRSKALTEIGRVQWIPDWGVNRIKAAVESRPDWCISRQRSWGVPIPAFYDAAGNPILDAQIVRNTAKLIEQYGSNVWFEKSAAELWVAVKADNWTGAEPSRKSADTLDVWIDSGSSSRAVLMSRPELNGKTRPGGGGFPWQAEMYLEGSDQHRGWFQSSLLLSLAGNGCAPYQTVLTHGFMVDADREKISKSKQAQAGAYVKPQTSEAYIRKYGADIVRLWVSSQDFRNDIVVSDERIAKVSESYRVVRNALRYQLSNLYDFDPSSQRVPEESLTGLDRWILAEFSKLEREVCGAYDRHEFHIVYQRVSQFMAVELSAIYHDVIKDRLYTDPANSSRRRSTQTALHRLVTGLCQLLAPVLSFTCDEAWEFVAGKPAGSIHESTLNLSDFSMPPAESATWQRLLSFREFALPKLEEARQQKLIGKALEAKLTVTGSAENAQTWREQSENLRELLNVSQFITEADAVPAKGPKDDVGHTPAKEDFSGITLRVSKADGQKCERCWHCETDIGKVPAHPTICGRCVEALRQFKST